MIMKKYSINYSRSFPDHRIPFEKQFYQKMKFDPVFMFRLWKSGFNINMQKYFAIHICTFTLFLFTFMGFYRAWGIDNERAMGENIRHRTSFKWLYYSKNPEYGRYDTILAKFEGQPGGITDWEFE